jgi:hypothetical protein
VNKILRCLHLRNIMIKSRPDGAHRSRRSA